LLFRRPHFTEYIMARIITVSVMIFVLFVAVLLWFNADLEQNILAISLVAIAFLIFTYATYRGAREMQNELVTLNNYIANLDTLDELEYKARFFTQEFEDLNESLIKALKKAKKREDIKQRYNAKLKLKNRQRADMISAIAHEFRNPIASIMGYSQTLREDPDIPPALQEKFLEKIYNNGNKIEALLGRLILWNKFESGEATLHQSLFDLHALVLEVIHSLEEKYKHREIKILGEKCMVDADRTLIEVVMKNLIENALKYSKEDIEVSVRHDASVYVKDYGVGIGKEDIEKVTKKFYRSGTHSWDNSMGLGLAIVKTILGLHGSQLQIESELGKGSIFSFSLGDHTQECQTQDATTEVS